MKNKSYFVAPMGVNADLRRHNDREIDLRNKIADADKAGNVIVSNAYKGLLNRLLVSKAMVADKIGRKTA